MIEEKIGTAAGKIWETLKANGPMTQRKLNVMSGLPADLANQGIGWLAREGKLTANGGARGDVLLTLRN
jgi:predicted HTH transcriptional regulator